MHIKLGNGDIEMGAVRLANGNWAVLLQKHDAAHQIGESANSVGEVYTPTERDVVIELGSIESGRVLQDAVNHALLFAVGHISPLAPELKSDNARLRELMKNALLELQIGALNPMANAACKRASIDRACALLANKKDQPTPVVGEGTL